VTTARPPALSESYFSGRQFKRISGLMKHKIPFIVADLGADSDPFMLHL
jgi:hypothetical protein